MKTIITTLFLVLFSQTAFAGGEYWESKISSIRESNEKTTISLVPKDKNNDFLGNCTEIIIESKHEYVPWFAWALPFVDEGHPSRKNHQQAIELLKQHFKSNKTILFGYIGYGLVPVENNECTYKSKGLKIEQLNNLEVVISYHDLT